MNRLSQEKSPYLLQHAKNPVDWYPWGDEAFARAKQENKPIFLSIGYATCHWCHVMERESFEDEEIAKILNEHFVNIKVDREERPDVDQIYMAAVQAMTGSGGWPLSVFLTPYLEPFYGGTYFPPTPRYGCPGFPTVLQEIAKIWRKENERVIETGQKLTEAIKRAIETEKGKQPTEEIFKKFFDHAQQIFDDQHGGFGPAPKFPRSEILFLLLRIYQRTGNEQAKKMVEKTLDAMAHGGIYDHLGGGFARYSTDERWRIPHFEKMLYVNALLSKCYLEAYPVTANEDFANVARETLDYILRDMMASTGGFYSAEDADSEGEEGKFYTWSESELKKILTDNELNHFKKIFPLSLASLLDDKYILHMDSHTPWSKRYDDEIQIILKKLFEHRSLRVRPILDDKIITSWNGLAISAMTKGYQILDDARYLEAARKAATFILKECWDGKALLRRHCDGDSLCHGTLDDYTLLTAALIDLFEADSDSKWINAAIEIQKRMDELFWDDQNGAYFFTDGTDKTLIIRMKEIADGAIPSGNSVAAMNLIRLHHLMEKAHYRQRFEALIQSVSGQLMDHPQIAPILLIALDFARDDHSVLGARIPT